jgi:hypothetical protein
MNSAGLASRILVLFARMGIITMPEVALTMLQAFRVIIDKLLSGMSETWAIWEESLEFWCGELVWIKGRSVLLVSAWRSAGGTDDLQMDTQNRLKVFAYSVGRKKRQFVVVSLVGHAAKSERY